MVTSLGVGAHLEAWGVAPERITELDWWEPHRLPGTDVVVTAAPSQHFSGRGIGDRNATLWSSFAIRSRNHAVFFSGDTGLTSAWGDIHLGPANAVQAHAWIGSGALLPIHWGTFSLATHPWDEPAETLLTLAERREAPLLLPRLGEALEPAHAPSPRAWWRRGSTPVASAARASEDRAPARLRDLPMPLD